MSNLIDLAALAGQFRGVALAVPPLERDILTYLADLCEKAASGADLEFDESAVIDLLAEVWGETIPANAAARLLSALALGVEAEWLEMTGLERFYESVGGSYEPDWDQGVLWQMIGAVFLRAGDGFRAALAEA